MRQKHGWDEALPAILISAGGFGAGNAGRMIEALVEAEIPGQIIAVCGKSATLKSSLEKCVARRKRGEVPILKVIGFTAEIDELMAAADLMVGKPGGLTTSESLIKGLGWVIVNPIPGQEEKNAIYLLEHGAGIWSDNLYTLGFKVRSLLDNSGRMEQMRRNALGLARPDAGDVIARFISNLEAQQQNAS